MKVERWEEESDEEWAGRRAEEIATADNTETTQYFIQQDKMAENSLIINYAGEGAWTYKEHPEGPFTVTQILGWKRGAELLPIYEKQYRHMTEHALELTDKLKAIESYIIEFDNYEAGGELWDAPEYCAWLEAIQEIVQSSGETAK